MTLRKRLLWITVGCTYFLMVWGNLVSSTGAGLACPDWPLCHGTAAPPLRWDIVLEWGHRTIAAFTSVLLVLSFALVWPVWRSVGKWVLTLLVIQILLGGLTVKLGLSVLVSTIHLGTALLVFSAIIYVASSVTWGEKTVLVERENPKLVRMSRAGLIGLLFQLLLGGLVRHSHAGLACPDFPACVGTSWLPASFYLESALAFTHRWWGILLLGLFVHLVLLTKKSAPRLAPLAWVMLGLVLFQIGLGIASVWTLLSVPVRAFHAAIGYFIWATLVFLSVRVGGICFPVEARLKAGRALVSQ